MLSRARIIAAIEEIYVRRVGGDKAEFAEIWAGGATYQLAGNEEIMGAALTRQRDARQAVGELIDQFRFHRAELMDAVIDGNRAAAVVSLDVSTGGGPQHQTQVFTLWEFDEDGKATSLVEFADTALIGAMVSQQQSAESR